MATIYTVNMMNILFHINAFNERGTSNAIYKYAHYNEIILGNYSYIISPRPNEFKGTREFFEHRFPKRVYTYTNFQEVDKIIGYNNIDIFYVLRSGSKKDRHIFSTTIPTCEHIIFCHDTFQNKRKAYISKWVSMKMSNNKIPFVPFVVELPETNEDLRKELDIPKSAVVFGRHGGFKAFNDRNGINAVIQVAKSNTNIFFIFVNTRPFSNGIRNIKYLSNIPFGNEILKTKFINTCDAMIHARIQGECFGLAIGEFSIRNKPIITNLNGRDKAHINMLGDKAIKYKDKKSLIHILQTFKKNGDKDWNAFKEFNPKTVMHKFHKIFLG